MEQFFSMKSPDGPGVDGIVIGPHDLSVSYELPEKYDSKEFIDLSCDIIRKAGNAVWQPADIMVPGEVYQLQMEWAKAGANIIMHSSDVFLFADKYQEDMNQIRALKGEKEIENQKE